MNATARPAPNGCVANTGYDSPNSLVPESSSVAPGFSPSGALTTVTGGSSGRVRDQSDDGVECRVYTFNVGEVRVHHLDG